MQALRGYKIFAATYRDDLIIEMVKTPEIFDSYVCSL